jgi:hypothetical protein
VRSLILPNSGTGFGPGGKDAEAFDFWIHMKRATRRQAKPARMEGEIDMGKADRCYNSGKEQMVATREYCRLNELMALQVLCRTYGTVVSVSYQPNPESEPDLSRDIWPRIHF